MGYNGDYPKLEELNDATCQERSIRIHYPEFHAYLTEKYSAYEKWGEKLLLFYRGLNERPKCPVCGKPLKFLSIRRGWTTACSLKCAGSNPETLNKKKKTSMERYGFDNAFKSPEIQAKMKKTCLERYGAENPYASEIIKLKIKQHNIEKYGGNSSMCSKEVREKAKKTCLERYGVEYSSQNERVKAASRKTFLEKYGGVGWGSKILMEQFRKKYFEKYGVEYVSQYRDGKTIFEKYPLLKRLLPDNNWLCECPHPECNKCKEKTFIVNPGIFRTRLRANIELCTKLLPVKSLYSHLELQVREWLDDANIEYLTNVRDVIPPKELDIYVPSKKVAIEINGCYWHSDKEKPKNYHIDKFEVCRDNGIRLIQIWEDWMFNKPEIVRSFLMSKLGYCTSTIYARKCDIREVCPKESSVFLENNHIQGKCNPKYSYGLYYSDELVSLMTFGYSRGSISKNVKSTDKYELLRFCNKLNTRVVGGASKLFNYFITHHNPSEVTSFSSNDISNGNLYKVLGFTTNNEITRSYWYIDPQTFKRYHRTSFTKSAIVKKGIKESLGSWTETEAMDEAGYVRIYDAGQTKWVKYIY